MLHFHSVPLTKQTPINVFVIFMKYSSLLLGNCLPSLDESQSGPSDIFPVFLSNVAPVSWTKLHRSPVLRSAELGQMSFPADPFVSPEELILIDFHQLLEFILAFSFLLKASGRVSEIFYVSVWCAVAADWMSCWGIKRRQTEMNKRWPVYWQTDGTVGWMEHENKRTKETKL